MIMSKHTFFQPHITLASALALINNPAFYNNRIYLINNNKEKLGNLNH
jgi:hypothetical protein